MRSGDEGEPRVLADGVVTSSYGPAFAGIQTRLRAMADARPFVFEETSAEDADRYLTKLKTFAGYSLAEIEFVERELNLTLPIALREFLLVFGSARGEFLAGEDLPTPAEWLEFRNDAQDLVRETDSNLTLPDDAIVFLFHQGYAFHFVHAREPDNPSVWTYVEGNTEFTTTGIDFLGLLEQEVELMEANWQGQHDLGGYFVTVGRDGTMTYTYPAQRDRPFRQNAKWWQFWRR